MTILPGNDIYVRMPDLKPGHGINAIYIGDDRKRVVYSWMLDGAGLPSAMRRTLTVRHVPVSISPETDLENEGARPAHYRQWRG